jgi:hypothetical protein
VAQDAAELPQLVELDGGVFRVEPVADLARRLRDPLQAAVKTLDSRLTVLNPSCPDLIRASTPFWPYPIA